MRAVSWDVMQPVKVMSVLSAHMMAKLSSEVNVNQSYLLRYVEWRTFCAVLGHNPADSCYCSCFSAVMVEAVNSLVVTDAGDSLPRTDDHLWPSRILA